MRFFSVAIAYSISELAICSPAAPGDEVRHNIVKVGLINQFSTPGTETSEGHGGFFRKGIELALEHSAPELARRGLTIELELFDYKSADEAAGAALAAAQSSVIAAIGYDYSSHLLAAYGIHKEYHLPVVSPYATADKVSELGPLVHLISAKNSYQAEVLARIAFIRLQARRVAAIVQQDCDYCVDLANAFEKAFRSAGGMIDKYMVTGGSESSGGATQIVAGAQPYDVFFIPNYELFAARTINNLLELHRKGPFIGADGWSNFGGRAIRAGIGGRNLEAYVINHWNIEIESPASRKFVSAFKAKYSVEPSASPVMAYDAMNYLLKGILHAESLTRAALERSLAEIKLFDGVSGKMHFDRWGAPRKDVVVLRFTGGTFRFFEIARPLDKDAPH